CARSSPASRTISRFRTAGSIFRIALMKSTARSFFDLTSTRVPSTPRYPGALFDSPNRLGDSSQSQSKLVTAARMLTRVPLPPAQETPSLWQLRGRCDKPAAFVGKGGRDVHRRKGLLRNQGEGARGARGERLALVAKQFGSRDRRQGRLPVERQRVSLLFDDLLL